jgi:catechol 2,3-dioxygenase-like lactoylglutathione lyase family enzyme
MTSPDRSAAITGVGQIAINVKDLDRAVAFYRDTLGMRYLFPIPNAAFFDCGGIRLMLGRAETPELDHAASIIYYRVDDIEATCAMLAGAGVTIEHAPSLVARMPDHDLWMAFFHDTEGNMLALMSEVRGPQL